MIRIFWLLLFSLTVSVPTWAETSRASSKGRASLFQSQLDVLDGRAAEQYRGSVRLQPPREIPPTAVRPVPESPYKPAAVQAARRHGVPPELFLRLVTQESGWDPAAVSPKGAIGLAQLMPQTARALNVDPNDPLENLDGGARYLRMQFEEFGNWPHALAAYNAGPEAVRRHDGIPPYEETRSYVLAIWGQ
ncbi:MAG: lytic transglycosylase domain-containing protein [Rhodobacteraceae bacterium]|nr:lytic transglycosylase domain-containing protein [Paracoccaceae bacterium]